MNTGQNLPRLVLWLFAFSLVCGFGKNLAAAGIERGRQQELAIIAAVQKDLTTTITASIEAAKRTHPKYTDNLTVSNLIDALDQEKAALVAAGDGPDPRPAGDATEHAARVVQRVHNQINDVTATITKLDTALSSYAKVADNIRSDSSGVTSRIASYVNQGYFKRHFTDAEVLTAQLNRIAEDVDWLMKQVDSRDHRPDYLRIYEIGLQSANISIQATALADNAPQLHQSVIDISASAEATRTSLIATLDEAYGAASRIERYSAYRSKDFSSGLRDIQQSLDNWVSTIGEVNRLNSMAIQDFNGARSLLDQVRQRLTKAETYITHVREFDAQIRQAVNSMASCRSNADSQIERAQSHINSWSQNNQSSAKAELQNARNDYDTANLRESSDPISAASYYRQAEAEADDAYNKVDTYTPPPPDTSSSPSNSSSSSYNSGSSSSFGSGGSSSSSSMGGSYGGPSSGSYGGGD